MIILAITISITILSAGCIDNSEKRLYENSVKDQGESEDGTVILARESVSGFSPNGYHNFVILFDNGHLYQINITNYQPENETDNDLTMEQVMHILNVTPTLMNWPLIDIFDDKGSSSVYSMKISKLMKISEDCFGNLVDMIDILRNSHIEPLYHGAGLTCMGWVYFTYNNGTSNTTISCYHDTSGAPDIIQDLDDYLDEICKREL